MTGKRQPANFCGRIYFLPGANLLTLTLPSASNVMSVAWSPDGSKIASTTNDKSILVWDGATGNTLLTLTGFTGTPSQLAWSPDGSKIASTTNDKSILVWDGATGNTLLTLTGFTGTPSQLAWSPDGSKIASGSFDHHVRVWNGTTGELLLTVDNGDGAGSVAWSPDGSKLAAVDGEGDAVKVWDATTGAALQSFPAAVTTSSPVRWSPDGSKISSATWNLSILIWDAATGASEATLTGHGDGNTGGGNVAMAWSPVGSRLATAGEQSVQVWEKVAPVAAATPTTEPTVAATAEATPASTSAATPVATPTGTPTATPTVDPNALAFEPTSLNFVWVKGSRSNPATQTVLARNVGGAGWHMGPWVNVPGTKWLPNGGGLQMTIGVAPANANLDVGVHDSEVVLVSNGMTATLPVKLTVVSADGKLQVNRQKLNFGGFVGDAIADQSVGLTFTGLNNTNWTASGPAWLTLTPANGSVAATAPTTLTVSVNPAAISGAGKYTDTLTVSDGKTTHQIVVELYQVAPGSPTIQLFGLEVTQGLQNLYNEIPFVAKRPVFVRGHVRSLTGERIEKVTAQLVGTRDGVELGKLDPINSGGSLNIVADPDRAKPNDNFLFELPESWRTGTVTLKLVGKSQPIACVDPAEKSLVNGAAGGVAGGVANDCTVTLTYETIPVLPITYFLYKDVGNVTLPNNGKSTANFEATASHANDATRGLMAGLPLPGVDQQIHSTILAYPGMRRSSSDNGRVLDDINKLYEKDGKPIRHYYGLFARYPTTTDPQTRSEGGPGGVAGLPGFTGMGEYYTFQPYSLLNAHEIAHNLERSHVACGNPASPDPKYPHVEQRISDALSGDAAYFGFNIYSKEIYPPTYKDMMTYCWPQWISPYTYKAIIERLKIHYAPAAGAPAGGASHSPSPILLVNGSIGGDSESGSTASSIDGVVSDDGFAASPSENASGYTLRLEDANGETIAIYPVTPLVVEGQNEGQNEGEEHEEIVSYTVAVPQPENLDRVVLLHESEPVAERIASANAPTLTLTTPISGESISDQSLMISWEASDDDGDELRFSVDYSVDDGESWHKLAWDWPESALEVESAQLPGSTLARIRVGANDGFHTTFVESEVFTVADHAPVALILSTTLNPYYVGGQSILLEGTGYDMEEGVVSDLTWYSDRDGVLGSGPTLVVEADQLSEGKHLIRLEAKDSTGKSSFGDLTSGEVSAETPVVANDTVSFDILYDPLLLPAELAVAPNLAFFTTPGATQLLTDTLTVSNLGDGTLEWTASSDAENVTLSSSGETPATVVVTVDPIGLAEGVHEGTVTFTPTDAGGDNGVNPVTLPYFIAVYPPSPLDSLLDSSNAYVAEYHWGNDDAPWNEGGAQITMCDATELPAPSAGAVTVRFVNESGDSVVISWRDFGGNLVAYHELDAGGYADQETFESHEWVAQDAAGNALLEYAASADATQCVVIEEP